MAVLIALLVVAVLAPLAMWRPAWAAAPVASFDRSMPDRFGLDRDHDGVMDYVEGGTGAMTAYATPEGRRVDVHACASAVSALATFPLEGRRRARPAAPDRRERRPGCGGASRWTSPSGARTAWTRGRGGRRVSAPLCRDLVDWDARPAGGGIGGRSPADRTGAGRQSAGTLQRSDMETSRSTVGVGPTDKVDQRRDVPLVVEPPTPPGGSKRAV
jgi:hypothetical protein